MKVITNSTDFSTCKPIVMGLPLTFFQRFCGYQHCLTYLTALIVLMEYPLTYFQSISSTIGPRQPSIAFPLHKQPAQNPPAILSSQGNRMPSIPTPPFKNSHPQTPPHTSSPPHPPHVLHQHPSPPSPPQTSPHPPNLPLQNPYTSHSLSIFSTPLPLTSKKRRKY